jgi:chorismate lyase/3-hydroxybenzoate synthase
MRAGHKSSTAVQYSAKPLKPIPPSWVERLLGDHPAECRSSGDPEVHLACRVGEMFSLVSAVLERPPDRDAQALAEAAATVYRSIGTEIRRHARREVVRIWNFVPDIQGRIRGAGDRYMAFNLGRYAAYTEWFQSPAGFRANMPTSSAVGVSGNSVFVHALICDRPGRPVENPRQIPAYRYSRRYGDRPPCFARGTLLDSMLLIGGTASILGELSIHDGDVEAQTRETFRNISALILAGRGRCLDHPLGLLRSLRVHVRDADDLASVIPILEELSLDHLEIEIVQARLCRPELLVEIEGVAFYS